MITYVGKISIGLIILKRDCISSVFFGFFIMLRNVCKLFTKEIGCITEQATVTEQTTVSGLGVP